MGKRANVLKKALFPAGNIQEDVALSRLKQGFDSPRERQLMKSVVYRIV
jgi:hypothetical protein